MTNTPQPPIPETPIDRAIKALLPFAILADRADGYRHEENSSCLWEIRAFDLREARAVVCLLNALPHPTPDRDDVVYQTIEAALKFYRRACHPVVQKDCDQALAAIIRQHHAAKCAEQPDEAPLKTSLVASLMRFDGMTEERAGIIFDMFNTIMSRHYRQPEQQAAQPDDCRKAFHEWMQNDCWDSVAQEFRYYVSNATS